MKHILVDNVNSALSEGLEHIAENNYKEDSRNGSVLVAPGPVITTYLRPMERVLFSSMRNANPFFHLMESLWMLGGRDDLAWPMFFNSRFEEYSDDGVTLHGAYGHRWRHYFGMDQIPVIIDMLKKEPTTRRAVLNMWNPESDLGTSYKDIPCNTHIYFSIHQEMLDMTVCCRSNDLWWGAYGANAVHFSFLQEYIAGMIGIRIGVYHQISNNFHLYTDIVNPDKLYELSEDANLNNRYLLEGVTSSPIFSEGVEKRSWKIDLTKFLNNPLEDILYEHDFFNHTARPMYFAWNSRKINYGDGLIYAEMIQSEDWRIACIEWIKRAEQRKENKI